MVSKFSEKKVRVSSDQSEATTAFLDDEYAAAKGKMDRLDAEIIKIKTENQGRFRERYQSNLATLTSLQQQLGALNEALHRNREERMILQTQLQNYKTQLNYYKSNLKDPPRLARQ
jgi:chromosome segregation ATPase